MNEFIGLTILGLGLILCIYNVYEFKFSDDTISETAGDKKK